MNIICRMNTLKLYSLGSLLIFGFGFALATSNLNFIGNIFTGASLILGTLIFATIKELRMKHHPIAIRYGLILSSIAIFLYAGITTGKIF